MSDKPTRVIDEDGSIYAAEIVPPEGDTYGAQYHVDLVRASVDEYGLGREQRLTVGQYSSWGEAEEHLHAVEDDLTEHGLAALGESAQQLREQPYGDDIFYLTAVYPPDGPADADHAAHLLAIGPDRLDSAPLTPPVDYAEAGLVRDRIDGAFAGEGLDAALIAAREEAERSGTRSLGTPLFDADDGAVRHIDGGVVRSDLRQGIGEAIGRSGGPDQFALGGFEQGRGGQDVQLGVPVALDDAVSQYLWSFAAVGHEHGVEAVVAAEVVVAGGDECGVALAVGVDEQDTAIAGFDMAQHVHQSQCDVGGRSGLADATLVVGENDGTGHDRGLLRKLIE